MGVGREEQADALLAAPTRVGLVDRRLALRVAGVGLADAVLDAGDPRAPGPPRRLHVAPARHEGGIGPVAAGMAVMSMPSPGPFGERRRAR